MLSNRKINELGKFSAYILRHGAHKEGIDITQEGWVSINNLIKKAHSQNHICEYEDIQRMVELDNKGRYQISDDGLNIRAVQGHSSKNVNITFKTCVPPDTLYHGTATRFMESINEHGINKGQRKYVHLSENIETATSVGKRHGHLIILKIDAKKMHEDGIQLFLSENNVWLTDFVDQKYFSEI